MSERFTHFLPQSFIVLATEENRVILVFTGVWARTFFARGYTAVSAQFPETIFLT